jgi:hypothetical protein
VTIPNPNYVKESFKTDGTGFEDIDDDSMKNIDEFGESEMGPNTQHLNSSRTKK